MRIAVCDDEKEQVAGNMDLIQRWAVKNQVNVNVDTFASAEEFLFRWSEGQPYDLLLLDIKMNKMTGIELARIIRKTDQNTQIIFITGIADHVFEGFELSALNYLLKPYKPEQFIKALEKAYSLSRQMETGSLMVSQEGRLIRIPYPEIIYMEIRGHYFDIYTKTMGEYRVKKQMNEMLSLLDDSLFIRCHRSFIVNVAHAAKISRQEVMLKNGVNVPLSTANIQPVTQLFLNYHYKHNITLKN